jgi:glycosyltransferase involved in cell wall biosynthesis/2-polyprenyl-3-methyl-5-hydroxy-6-metoxy-1,4-benzoquinol methylase
VREKNIYMDTGANKLYISSERHYELDEIKAGDIDIDNRNSAHSLLISQVGENSFILDVGCAYGYLGEWLIKNKRCTVYGIEVDKIALHKVRSEGLYKDVFEIDLDYSGKYLNELERFNELNIEFDFIICGDVLEHLKDPTTILTMLSDRLKDRGKILISVPNVANIEVILKLIEGEFNYSETGILDSTHLRFFTKNSFIEWIESINSNILKECRLDVALVGSTKTLLEFANYIKTNYPNTYSILTDAMGEDANVLQYVFVLTKNKLYPGDNFDNNKSLETEPNHIQLIEERLHELTWALECASRVFKKKHEVNSRHLKKLLALETTVADLKNKLTNKDEILQKVLSNFYRIIPMNFKTRPSMITDKISVIIPVKNSGEQLRGLLSKIRSQRKVKDVEIIVIDSESTDNSVDIAVQYGARVIKIPQNEFNHGATRNLGAKEAKGDYLVFTVQDAMPINDYYLYNMICPFTEYPELAAISSKQFIKPEADLFSIWMGESLIKSLGLERDTIYSLSDAPKEISLEFFDSVTKRRLTFFDNVSSCIKRSVFKEIQFSPLINAEDIDYGVNLIERKKTLGYLTSTGVYHWHERGADYVFKRHYIGTKANVYVLKNELQYFFDINDINWQYLAANLLGLYDLISISISEIGEVSPEPIKAVQSFINALQKNMDTLPTLKAINNLTSNPPSPPFSKGGMGGLWIEKTSKLESSLHGNDGLEVFSGEDGGLGLLLREIVDGDDAFILKQKYNFKQNFLIPDFMKRLENFAEYLCSKHHTLNGREKDFISCIYKILAVAAGEALGAYYLEAETLNRLTPELKRIDRLLGKGVCY